MIVPDYSARDLLAANLERLMAEHPDKATPSKLSKRCFWPAGDKKGEPVAPRTIRYVLDRRAGAAAAPSPSLDLIVALAEAFGLPAWQLLVDDRQLRTWMVGKLFTSGEAVTDAKVEAHIPRPPGPNEQRLHEPGAKGAYGKKGKKK